MHPLTVPKVPTGIKVGVEIAPLSVNIFPDLAFVFEDLCVNLKNISKF